MKRHYGAVQLVDPLPTSMITIEVDDNSGRTVARLANLPGVKDQGTDPVCSAVVATTLYEQLLLRDGLHTHSSITRCSNWAWIFLFGQRLIASSPQSKAPTHEQLLQGLPLAVCLQALATGGLLQDCERFSTGSVKALQRELSALSYSPRGQLLCPLRVVSLLPTAEALHDAVRAQHAVGFAFAIDATIDRWMHSAQEQIDSYFQLPIPQQGSARLATHAAVITAVDLINGTATVQNSFGPLFGTMGFFFIPLHLLLQSEFSGLQFYILIRAG